MCVYTELKSTCEVIWSYPIWNLWLREGACGYQAHTEWQGQARGNPAPETPCSAPHIPLCCLHFSAIRLWTRTFPFFSRKNQLPVSNKVDEELAVLQIGRYQWDLSAVPTRVQGLHLVHPGGGGALYCWGEDSFPSTPPQEEEAGLGSETGFSHSAWCLLPLPVSPGEIILSLNISRSILRGRGQRSLPCIWRFF